MPLLPVLHYQAGLQFDVPIGAAAAAAACFTPAAPAAAVQPVSSQELSGWLSDVAGPTADLAHLATRVPDNINR